jgi:DnaK suppressor protein
MASKKQVDELKIILEEKCIQIENNIFDAKNNIAQLKENECKDDFDFAESSSDSFTLEAITKQQVNELTEIKNALQAIKNNTYGICDMCDENISIGRLKAKPFAKYCTSCREIYEEENK